MKFNSIALRKCALFSPRKTTINVLVKKKIKSKQWDDKHSPTEHRVAVALSEVLELTSLQLKQVEGQGVTFLSFSFYFWKFNTMVTEGPEPALLQEKLMVAAPAS